METAAELQPYIPSADDSDDEVGPAPPPAGHATDDHDPVREFMKKEEQRRKAVEVCASFRVSLSRRLFERVQK